MNISKNSVSIAGEFAVLSQLALRGFDANMTLGNTKGVDILASYPDTGSMYKIEVKTSYDQKPSKSKLKKTLSWIMGKKNEKLTDPNLFYCFVNINSKGDFRFFVVPSIIVAKYVRESHQHWLKTDRKRKDNPIRNFRLGLRGKNYSVETPLLIDYENKWELFK